MSVSMASGRKMEFISARVSGKDEGTGIEDGDWERADEGFDRVQDDRCELPPAPRGHCGRTPKWEEEGGGS